MRPHSGAARRGSDASAAAIASSSAAGTSSRNVETFAYLPPRTAALTTANVFPSKGGMPVSISYRMTPSAHTSDRASRSFAPVSCSGDM